MRGGAAGTECGEQGMIWAGDDDELEAEAAASAEAVAGTLGGGRMWDPDASAPPEHSVDYDAILRCVEDLNALAGEGVGRVAKGADGAARIMMPDPVPLALYSDGIMLFEGPFRPFSDPSTQQCVQDLTDGYFPSELQARFPDGIPFKVTDRRGEAFVGRDLPGFSGSGFKLGGECGPSRLVHAMSDAPGQRPAQSVASFVGQLPKSVIKDGNVVDVRAGIAEMLQPAGAGKAAVAVVETAAASDMKARAAVAPADGPPAAGEARVATVQIKSPSTGERLVLRMRFAETIADLRRYIDTHRGSTSTAYRLIAGFPRKVWGRFSPPPPAAALTRGA